jgi:IclR family transcriptional regulator, pca regulon regulatory protein
MSTRPAPVRRPPKHTVEALSKALQIMTLFTEQRPVWRYRDISETTKLRPATVYRLLMTLTYEGYLDHLPGGEYRPGIRAAGLAPAVLRGLDLVELATPPLDRLADRTRETVSLGVLSGDRIVYLLRLRSRGLFSANIRVGSTLPAARSAIGRLLVTGLDDRACERGWAMQDDEPAAGLRSVAAAIHGVDGEAVAAAHVAVRASEWPAGRVIDDLVPALLATCAEISTSLGCCPQILES